MPTTTPAHEPARTNDPREAVSLRRVAGRGALASAGVEMGGRALSLLLSLAVARTLGPKETGLLGLAVLFSALVSFVGALPETAAVAAPRERTDNSWALAACLLRILALLAMGVVAALVFFVVYPHSRYAGADAAPRLLWISGILLLIPLFEGINTYPQIVFQRELRLSAPIRAQGAQYLVSSVAGLGALALGLGIEGVAMAAALGALIASFFLWAQAWGKLGPTPHLERTQVLQLAVGTGRIAVGNVGGYVFGRIDNVLVATSLGATAMGLYAMAWNTSRLPLFILSRPVTVALLPALASIQGDAARVTRGIRECLTLLFIVLGGCSAAVAVSAPSLVSVVLGPKWLPIVPCLRLMALTAFVSVLAPIGSALLTAAGQAHVQLWPAVLGIACFLLLMPPVATRYGLLGAVFVDLLAASSVTLATYVLARRSLPDVKWWSREQLPPVLAVISAALVAWLVGRAAGSSSWRLIVEFCMLGGSYVGFLRLFGGRELFRSIRELVRRLVLPNSGGLAGRGTPAVPD